MYNPVNRALKLLDGKNAGRYKHRPVHPSVRWAEIFALLSFLPGMLLFPPAFIFSGVALFATGEIPKGSYWLVRLLFIIFNIIPSIIIPAYILISGSTIPIIAIGLFFLLYFGLGMLGLVATELQSIEDQCSE